MTNRVPTFLVGVAPYHRFRYSETQNLARFAPEPRTVCTCYGQPGDRSPGCRSRTVRASFPAHGSSSCWPWSSASRLSGTRQISFRGIALQCAEGTCLSDAPATGRPAFQQTAPTWAYPRHYPRPSLLGRSYACRALAGCLLRILGEPLQGFPVPCIDGSVRVGPCYTPAPQRVETENRIVFSAVGKISFGPCSGSIPFWACLSASFGRIGLTMPQTHVCFRCPYGRARRDSASSSPLPPFLPRSRRLRASRPPQADAFTLST